MLTRTRQNASPSRRRGSMLPAIALALLVTGGCMALVLNQYYLAGTQEELHAAAQAAALAAAQQLACDELLKPEPDAEQIAQAARDQAQRVIEQSQIAGRSGATLDVRLGRTVVDSLTGYQQMLETDYLPTTVLLRADRNRWNNNPVRMVSNVLSNRQTADVGVIAEASVTNLILGVRAITGAAAPVWPIAVLESSPDPRVATWLTHIEGSQGTDRFAWNDEQNTVLEQSDGLPELTLLPRSQQGLANLVLLNLGSGMTDDVYQRQFERGLTADDLASWDGMLSLQQSLTVPATDNFGGIPERELTRMVGHHRIFLLYLPAESDAYGNQRVELTRLVAGRIMQVTHGEAGMQTVIQPSVVVTRMAVLDEDALYSGTTNGNRYIYKLSITQ